MKKKALAYFLAAGLLLTACGNQEGESSEAGSEAKGSADQGAGSAEEIRLGGSGPLTGVVSNYGISSHNGAKMAIDEINAQGGILGKQIKWMPYDDQNDVTQAVTAYNKLVEDGVDAILGDITSKPTLAMAETAVNDGLPVVTPTGTQDNITEGKPNVFRVAFTDSYQGTILAVFATDNLKAKSYAILSNASSDYSQGVAKQFKEKADALGLVKVAEESYSEGDTDFKAQLTNIKNQKPDVLLMPDYYEVIAMIAPQARQVGIEATFLGGDGWDGVIKTMDESQLSSIEGSYFCNHFAIDSDDEKIKTFVKGYKDLYGEDPTAFSALSYDTAYMLKQAFEAAGSTDKEAVVKAIKEIKFEGVTGDFTYDENNNPIKSATMLTIKDGKYTYNAVVEPR